MGRRFGRNQKRRLKEEIEKLKSERNDQISKRIKRDTEYLILKSQYDNLSRSNITMENSFTVEIKPADTPAFFTGTSPEIMGGGRIVMRIVPEVIMLKECMFTEETFEHVSINSDRVADKFCDNLKPFVSAILTKHMVEYNSCKNKSKTYKL